jgi:hypothetical protein
MLMGFISQLVTGGGHPVGIIRWILFILRWMMYINKAGESD